MDVGRSASVGSGPSGKNLQMFDTHAHLNFSRFKKNVAEVIAQAREVGVVEMVIPSTDIATSLKALEIANVHEGVYAAVGIHPHHVFDMLANDSYEQDLTALEDMLKEAHGKSLTAGGIVAVGEIGLDKHEYEETKYENYHVGGDFFGLQKKVLVAQLKLAVKYEKPVILHNRETAEEMMELLREHWNESFAGKMVLHCCEPRADLLDFALQNRIFIGVDGDVTYTPEKRDWIAIVPLDMLVVETDSPFLLPEPLRTEKKYPNVPANIPLIIDYVANIKKISPAELAKTTTNNARRLFGLS